MYACCACFSVTLFLIFCVYVRVTLYLYLFLHMIYMNWILYPEQFSQIINWTLLWYNLFCQLLIDLSFTSLSLSLSLSLSVNHFMHTYHVSCTFVSQTFNCKYLNVYLFFLFVHSTHILSWSMYSLFFILTTYSLSLSLSLSTHYSFELTLSINLPLVQIQLNTIISVS